MQLVHLAGLASVTLFATACGDDGGATPVDAAVVGNPGFSVPTMVTKANMKMNDVWIELGDADWSCLGTPPSDQASTQPITLSGKVVDFQSQTGVGTATVTAFAGIDLTGSVATATTDNTMAHKGEFTMTLPTLPGGTTRFGFRFESANYVKTYLLNQYFDPASATATRSMQAVSESTATVLPALLSTERDLTKGVLAGAMRDCQSHEVSNAVATVSATAGTADHLPGASTFYFSAGSMMSLPVNHNAMRVMNKDGLFVVLDLPPQTTPAYIQIWGFRNAAELAAGTLTLLSELAAPIEANAVITASVEVKRQ
jgi:hypothetical protein